MGWEKEIPTWAPVAVVLIMLAALCWSIWRHCHQTKLLREQRQESVSLEASTELSNEFPSGTVWVELVNTGHIPVYVDEVSLCWRAPQPSRRKIPGPLDKLGLAPVEERFPLSPVDQKENPVAVGDRRRYYLSPAIPTPILAGILKRPSNHVSVAAYSPKGEIGCVSGNRVFLGVKAMVYMRAQSAPANGEQTAQGANDLG